MEVRERLLCFTALLLTVAYLQWFNCPEWSFYHYIISNFYIVNVILITIVAMGIVISNVWNIICFITIFNLNNYLCLEHMCMWLRIMSIQAYSRHCIHVEAIGRLLEVRFCLPPCFRQSLSSYFGQCSA